MDTLTLQSTEGKLSLRGIKNIPLFFGDIFFFSTLSIVVYSHHIYVSMSKLAISVKSRFLLPIYRLIIPSHDGDYYITPSVPYLSQFIRIQPGSITPQTQLTNPEDIKEFGAKDSTEFSFWAWRDCGIVCVKMILNAYGKAKDTSIMDLTNEGIKLGGYIAYDENGNLVDRGWYHQSLVDLLHSFGIKAKRKDPQSIESVANDILHNRLVMISVLIPGRAYINEDGAYSAKPQAKYGGHLLLGIGVRMKGKLVEGIYVHDPMGLPTYQANTFIPKEVFNKICKRRTIVALPPKGFH
jgi:hypothetical protein